MYDTTNKIQGNLGYHIKRIRKVLRCGTGIITLYQILDFIHNLFYLCELFNSCVKFNTHIKILTEDFVILNLRCIILY